MTGEYFTPEEKENFQHAFNAFDDDRDGKIPPKQLGKLLRAVGFNPYPEEVQDMIADACPHGAMLEFDGFYYLLSQYARAVDPEADLVASFRLFDKRGTGRLSEQTIANILRSIKHPFTESQIDEILSQATRDENSMIDYREFVQLMLDF
jgi:Ca2+-binding EF-hand superfamily protein